MKNKKLPKLDKKSEKELTELVENVVKAILFMDKKGKKATFVLNGINREFVLERTK